MTPVRLCIIYTGRVQGVGFRATVADLARHHPITGWVRNEPDGTVRLEAQGQSADLDSFLQSITLHRARHIANQHQTSLPMLPNETDFRIAY